MSTTIAKWGNSSGVRIPTKVLENSNLEHGEEVDVFVNERGNIEIAEAVGTHRRVKAPRRVTAEDLFRQWPAGKRDSGEPAWPNDDMVGAEWESWAR